jgi:membrane glycosyltransferase
MDGGLSTRSPGPLPPEAGLSMPTQNLNLPYSWRRTRWFDTRAFAGRIILWLGTIALTAYGVHEMLAIVAVNDTPTPLQRVMVVFFGLTLAWISQAAASAIAGLLPSRRTRLEPHPATPTRTALVMPIYNEDALRTTASLRAMAEGLAERGAASGFEILILSDTTQPDAWITETQAVAALREALRDVMPVWYRRRWRNTGRKVGNLQDFIERWGGRYDFMITLDADSLMEADTLIRLQQAMQADPKLGLLQTVPRLVGRASVYARLQQFGSRLYGPPAARGVAAWSGNEGNYWGHNAIVRIEAFASSCGLPVLKGRKHCVAWLIRGESAIADRSGHPRPPLGTGQSAALQSGRQGRTDFAQQGAFHVGHLQLPLIAPVAGVVAAGTGLVGAGRAAPA